MFQSQLSDRRLPNFMKVTCLLHYFLKKASGGHMLFGRFSQLLSSAMPIDAMAQSPQIPYIRIGDICWVRTLAVMIRYRFMRFRNRAALRKN
jgi:hypothetical protein